LPEIGVADFRILVLDRLQQIASNLQSSEWEIRNGCLRLVLKISLIHI
jgi:hypothetical protein